MIRFGSRAVKKPSVDPALLAEHAAAEAQMQRVDAQKARHADRMNQALGVRPWAGEAVEPYMVYRVRFLDALRGSSLPDELELEGARIQAQSSAAWSRRWDARKAVGLDPRTGAPPTPVRRQNRVAGVESGSYPDLLEPTEDLRRGCTPRRLSNDGTIVHTSCYDNQFHHLRYRVGDEVVAGLTLYAGRPWRGQQVATIDRVYTRPGYRRSGYARALLDHARDYFRRVDHSVDLTEEGATWKAGVQAPRRGRRRRT